jgi:hypothetical protein
MGTSGGGAQIVRARVFGFAAFAVSVLLLAAVPAFAQTPPSSAQAAPPPRPPSSFVPPYEIMRTARAAGFDPLAPPLREGTAYVLRATDYRGILMRVVVDARSGAIRDATRIVSAADSYEPNGETRYGMMAPYEPSPGDGPQPYGAPQTFGPPALAPAEEMPAVTPRPPTARTATRATGSSTIPLPRPRPAELAARKSVSPDTAMDAKALDAHPASVGKTPAAIPPEPLND